MNHFDSTPRSSRPYGTAVASLTGVCTASVHGRRLQLPANMEPEEIALSAGTGGATVAALRWGDPACPRKAIAIHGRLDNAASFLGIGPLFAAAGIELVALDLPGHGKSSWKDDGMYTLASQSSSILLALDSLASLNAGWDKDVIMIAHSLG